ncbi:MAG: tetratricopeptide repeat protein [Chitinispirillaceae bacterium]|nr:tetratricopeptide repeat protein [Chitinispirillaceae bacterium]
MKKTFNLALIVLFLLSFLNISCSNQSPEQLYEKGNVLAESRNIKKAYTFFKNAANKDPENITYLIAAGSTAPDQNAAYIHFKNAWEKGAKNKLVLSNLTRLSFHVDINEKRNYALSLYDELPDSLKSLQFRGELFFQFGVFDSAISIWKKEFIKSPSPELSNSISLAFISKKEIDSALNVLLDSKKSGILNAQTYIQLASLFAAKMDYKAVNTLYSEVQNSVFDNSLTSLEFASFFLIHNNLDKALSLIKKAEQKVPANQEAFVSKKLRCMKAFLALTQNKKDDLDALISGVTDSPDETALLNAFKAFLSNDSSSLKMLENAREKNPRDPFIDIVCARSNLLSKNYEKALSYYHSLPGIIQWSPRILTEIILSYAASGKEDEALKRINFMHKQGVFTRKSLEIFRDITFRKDLIDKSTAAQKLLEQQYGNDINVKWHSLLLSIKSNRFDTAEVIINELIKKAPDNERFKMTHFSIMFLKKDYQRIIKELPSSGLPEERTKPIEAMAWLKSGDTTNAINVLEQSVQKFQNLQTMVELAQLYLNTNNNSKAASLYQQIINHTETSKAANSTTAALLNNYAWVLSSSDNGDITTALDAAKRAYSILPDNLSIIDTYTSILLKAGKFKDCIKVIESSQTAMKQARLIHYLAQSYEETGNINKAKRYYENVLSLEPSEDLPLTESKQMIRQRIEKMISEK